MADVNMRTGTAIYTPSVSFTRPADTTAYAIGDLVANSVTAASVVPLTWPATISGSFYPAGIRLAKTGTSLTNAQFRIHLYKATPTIATTGDNASYKADVSGNANWLGSFDGTMVAGHADGCAVVCAPTEGLVAPSTIGEQTAVFGLIEALAAYTPASAEVFTVTPLMELN